MESGWGWVSPEGWWKAAEGIEAPSATPARFPQNGGVLEQSRDCCVEDNGKNKRRFLYGNEKQIETALHRKAGISRGGEAPYRV